MHINVYVYRSTTCTTTHMYAYMFCSIDRNGSVALLCRYLAGGGAHVAVRPGDDVGIAPTTGALYAPTQTDKQTNRQTNKQTDARRV